VRQGWRHSHCAGWGPGTGANNKRRGDMPGVGVGVQGAQRARYIKEWSPCMATHMPGTCSAP
jgi:hypothetical protein